jgi:hypothetical protein
MFILMNNKHNTKLAMKEDEKQNLTITFKSNLLLGPSKQLTISNEFIELTKAGKSTEKAIRFDKADIVAYRFGIKWISGYAFTIGREYHIFVKDKADREMKISLQSLYGFKKAVLGEQYSEIMQSLWVNHFKDLANAYLKQLSEGNTVTLCGVQLTQQDVTIETKNRLINKKLVIPWEQIGTKDYYTYYAIFSTENPADINRGYYYMDEWNAGILYTVVETLKEQFSESN